MPLPHCTAGARLPTVRKLDHAEDQHAGTLGKVGSPVSDGRASFAHDPIFRKSPKPLDEIRFGVRPPARDPDPELPIDIRSASVVQPRLRIVRHVDVSPGRDVIRDPLRLSVGVPALLPDLPAVRFLGSPLAIDLAHYRFLLPVAIIPVPHYAADAIVNQWRLP